MDISIRLIRKDSTQDRENYFALQKSVTLFPDMGYEDKVWQEQFENRNRICYVIETESIYRGECAVKDISADIPEIEIELMREYQHKGIGYKAIIMMLNTLSEKYGKQEFYAKIEPDNYASQFLLEKLGEVPAGLAKDFQISDERAERFVESHRHLIDDRMQNAANIFEVEPEDFLRVCWFINLMLMICRKMVRIQLEQRIRENISCA